MKRTIFRVLGARFKPSSLWSRRSLSGCTLLALAFLLISENVLAGDALEKAIALEIAPNTPLDEALVRWSAESGLQVLMSADGVRNEKTKGLRGRQSANQALATLLRDSGLSYTVEGNTILVVPAHFSDQAESKPAISSDVPKRVEASDGSTSTDARRSDLEEVVVSAQKRDERLQDVPVPVAVISAGSLMEQNQLRLQDYYTGVPGLSVANGDFRGNPGLTIRGVTTGGEFANPTVGIVIDDVPIGSTSGNAGGGAAVDLDPSDLARIEVLRGPQGTLYGASSIGGLLKYVTLDPSTDTLSGHVRAGASTVHNGPQVGYNLNAGANIPISETWAVRASGFYRQDPGYVENVQTGQRGVNEERVGGGHISALWQPLESVSLKLSALLQEVRIYGSSAAEPRLGDLEQADVRGTGRLRKNTQAYSAILKANIGGADLTVLSGYSVNSIADSIDETPIWGPVVDTGIPGTGFDGFGVPGAATVEHVKTNKFVQEARLSIPLGQHLDWLFGGFYTHESSSDEAQIYAVDPKEGTILGTFMTLDSFPTSYAEYAAFTDLTFHVTDRLDLQIGGREGESRQTYTETITGIIDPVVFGLPSPVVNPEVHTKDNSFTYLVTPSYKLSSNFMIYSRIASGYRPGGPNPTCTVYDLPCSFKPDKTKNYEIGTKADFLGHRLTIDGSLYYIDWKEIQIQLTQPTSGALYYVNASRAKSEGAELALGLRPFTGFKIAAWLAWNEAVLTRDFPPGAAAYGVTGDKLPYSSRWSGNLSVDEDFPIFGDLTGFVGGAVSYVGDREGVFTSSPQRQLLPSYSKTDVRAGVRGASWSINLFVDNVADKRGLLGGGIGSLINPNAFTYIQPRTVGVSVERRF